MPESCLGENDTNVSELRFDMNFLTAFLITWIVLYAMQVAPTSLLIKRAVKREMGDGVALFIYLVVLPATSYVGATWIANKYF